MSCVSWPFRKAAASGPCGQDHAPVRQAQRRRRRRRWAGGVGHAAIIIFAHVFDVQGVALAARGDRRVAAAGVRLAAASVWWWLDRPLPLAAPAVELSIEPGTTPRDVASGWVAAGVQASPGTALPMVPLVGPGAAHPRRQLRGRGRHHAPPAAGQDGAGRRDAGKAAPGRRLDLAPGARGAGRRAAPEAGEPGHERGAADAGAGRCRGAVPKGASSPTPMPTAAASAT